MPFIVPFIPLIAAVAGPLLAKAIGGGGGGDTGGGKTASPAGGAPAAAAAAAPAVSKLFSDPNDITKATDQYKQAGLAKWNQIFSNMGGAPGGVNINDAINSQAESMAGTLGGLTTASGYGDKPTDIAGILRGAEPGIGAKYPVY